MLCILSKIWIEFSAEAKISHQICLSILPAHFSDFQDLATTIACQKHNLLNICSRRSYFCQLANQSASTN